MDFLELVKWRYTAKKYNPNKKISEEQIRKLKEIIRLSPSSINSQPWKLIFVSDEKLKQKLASASYFNEQKINEASHLVVFSAIDDVRYFENRLQQTRPASVNYYNQYLKSQGEAGVKSWMQHQVYLSLGFFLLACAGLGIDSTAMEGIETEKYDNILELKGYKTLFAVAIGYRNAEDQNQPSVTPKSRFPFEEILESL